MPPDMTVLPVRKQTTAFMSMISALEDKQTVSKAAERTKSRRTCDSLA